MKTKYQKSNLNSTPNSNLTPIVHKIKSTIRYLLFPFKATWLKIYTYFYGLYTLLLGVSSLSSKSTGEIRPVVPLPELTTKSIVTRDGVKLYYYTQGKGPKIFVFATGLGFASVHLTSVVGPLLRYFGEDTWTFITWDYRGLFDSGQPKTLRKLAIPEHAFDLYEILQHEGFKNVDVLCGWSMGVQVILEFVLQYPEYGKKCIFLNGTHGQVFQSVFQPITRLPFTYRLCNYLICYFKENPWDVNQILKFLVTSRIVRIFEYLYLTVFTGYILNDGAPIVQIYGVNFLEKFVRSYIEVLYKNPRHAHNYLCMFQELDAHSVFHLLNEVKNDTLIISGLLDVLTPVYLSHELARRIPNSKHVVVNLGTHFVLFEQNNYVVQTMIDFLEKEEKSYPKIKKSSLLFE